MAKVLLLGEESEMLAALRAAFVDTGHEVLHLPPRSDVIGRASDASPDLLVLNVAAREGGDRLIRLFKTHDTLRYSPILLVSDGASGGDEVAALQVGADDYLSWPVAGDELHAHLQVMLRIRSLYTELRRRNTEAQLLRTQIERRHSFDNIIGTSVAMRRVFDLIDKVTPTSTTVLVTGESGTGKELVARAIHYNSPRRHKNFIIQNCSVFNDNLLESELFGHVKGAFTGAIADKQGLFQLADGGTLFLDEVGDMSPALQVKVLRVLQEGTFIPVGGVQPCQVDVRVISATNRSLEDMVKKGTFREDLYYRLHVFQVGIPPLRERTEDVPVLAEHFLETYCQENGLAPKVFAPEVLDALSAYEWPGNVREMENEIERVVIMAREDHEVALNHLSPRLREAAPERASTRGRRLEGRLSDAIQDLERAMLAEGLRRNRWNKSQTARELGISRANLVSKVKKYNLQRPPDDARPAGGQPPA